MLATAGLPILLQAQSAAERLAAARAGLDIPLGQRLIGFIGIGMMILLAYLMSWDRKRINWRLVASGFGLQALFGVVVLKTEYGRLVFQTVGDWITALLGFQEQGARFVFGNLVQSAVPVTGDGATAGMVAQTGAFFAFNVLPTIIFFSALMSVMYYLGIMQLIVKGLAVVMQRTLGTSGAETLSASGNIFLGQTEAPLLIKPFVGKMTNSELNTVMIGGFATVAGGVLAAYVGMLSGMFPGIAAHLLAASVMNAPAGLAISKILLPETEVPETAAGIKSAAAAVDRPPNTGGWFARLLNPRAVKIEHSDAFYMPNVTHVVYRVGPRRHFLITSQSVPISDDETLVYTDLTFDFGPLSWFVRPIVRWQGQRVIDQDIVALGRQMEVIQKYGAEFHNSPVDVIHVLVESIRGELSRGRDPRELPDRAKDIEFWV